MISSIAAIFITVFVVGVPIAIFMHETEKAVNYTTVQCIEKPDICKMRYEYMKLGDNLNKVELDELVKKQK
jgi:hypothetical protein